MFMYITRAETGHPGSVDTRRTRTGGADVYNKARADGTATNIGLGDELDRLLCQLG